jgi:hypothetical protein
MWFLRSSAGLAFLTIPFALDGAGDSHSKIPLMCLLVGATHLFAIFAPKKHLRLSVGLMMGSSLLLLAGFTFITILSALLSPTSGQSWPWVLGKIAHGLLFLTAILLAPRIRLGIEEIVVPAISGVWYTVLSIVLIQVLGHL